ncbi:hypothetical protein ACFOQM_14605 [Paenibacillus sp. GCM10012307]|uniref:Uncharacterized protein n=1 Tax=Paenibacillus roseus TaxID=2798579 RepID=A0A934J6G8_9BACL|nr:hypothetical protein [Paenibacillus roseus]MBJ6362493.1 hypothetical protein [Paenibacillus roseus]
MGKLSETLALERCRLFVGRDAEIAAAQQWIQNQNAPTEVLFISGIGGVGKSSLMMRIIDLTAQANQLAIWIDGRVCPETPAGFVEALFDSVKQNFGDLTHQTFSNKEIIQEIFKSKTLLCIDNYESIQMIDSWLREVFLPQLPATGLMVLLVSRKNLSEPWQHDLAWRSRVKHIALLPFIKQEVMLYLFRNGITKSVDTEQIFSETQGLPLALALTSEKLQQVGSHVWPLSLRINAELMREVTAPDLLETLELLCILPQATPEWLGRLLRTPLDADKLLKLSRISFVRPTADGFALHDVARYYLKEDMMRREPERVQSLRTRIVMELVQDIKSSDIHQRRKLTSILLSTCRDAFQINSVPIIPQDIEHMQMEAFQPSDLPHLMRILQDQDSLAVSIEKDLIVLQQLAEQFPECIRVYRSKETIPLAFCSGFHLYRETTAFHETFFPGMLEQAFPGEIEKMRTQSVEESNTYYHLLAGTSERDSDHTFWELMGIIIAEWLILYSAGLRLVMINTYEGLNGILFQLGYRMRPLTGLPEDHPFCHATIRELDWRDLDVGDRILELFGMKAPKSTSPLSKIIPDRAIKSALPLAEDPVRLEQTELAKILELSGIELQDTIQKLLWGDLIFPLDERMQQLLRLMSTIANLTAEIATKRLHVSRATYFRIRADALRVLKELLLLKCS